MTQVSDWLARSTGSGVVWAHNLDTQSEIDKFRWHASEGALSGGNLPNLAQAESDGYSQVDRLTYDTTDGFAGGGCINILVPAGSNSDKIAWWRPLSALASPGNGKAADDPGANGTLARRTWSPTNNVDATFNFQKGYFGNATEQALNGADYAGNTNVWDGTDFYLQFRCKFSASRFRTDQPQGKLLYIDILGGSGEQEVLLRANQKMSWNQNTGAFDIYTSFGNHLQSFLGSVQGDTGATTAREPGGAFAATCTFGAGVQTCFEWPADTWVTVLVHVIPGQNAYRTVGFDPGDQATWTSAPKDAGLQVWVAPQGQPTYTKIWDKTDYIWIYSSSDIDVGNRNPAGFNAVAVRAYINSFDGSHASVDFTHKYTQFVLSKNFIACPQV
ncbi:MAG TPA: hypothetical protein VFB54_07290 [Burkholderiales bacterium]|nr:hypothetical protein [Burkholderiales bacterium]